MKIFVTLKTRSDSCNATAEYLGESIIVKAGGTISDDFADHIRGGRQAKRYRNDPEYVQNRIILKDCVFDSPSTAAQFVTGRSTNGYEAWKVDQKKTLGAYLKEQGLR